MDCLILGDSIAVGTHQFRPECVSYAKGGINTWQFNKKYTGNFLSDVVIISLGSNDHSGVKTEKELESMRTRVVAKSKVYWVLPAIKPNIQEIVKKIAEKNGDTIIEIKALQPDKIHPSWNGYKQIAKETKL